MFQLFLVSAVATTILYGFSLSLPFFFDDLDHIPFAINTPYAEIFGSSGGFPYFRPIGVASHRFIAQLSGGRNTLTQHAANLLLHSLNGGLVGLLVVSSQAKKAKWKPLLATFFFVIFPYSYQVVPWIDARYHLLVLTLLLTAVLASQCYAQTGNRRWLLLAALACFLAPLTHENGNAAAVLPLCSLILNTNRQWAKIALAGVISLGSTLAGFWVWRSAAPPTSGLEINSLETLFQTSAYFLQGAGWLIAWPGGWLMRMGINDLLIAITAGVVTIGAAVWVGYRARQLNAVLFALIWFGAGSLLTILFLGFTYVIDGPRLLYVASAGISLIWAGLVQDGIALSGKRWQRGLILFLTLAGSGSAGVFHLKSYQLYQLAGDGFDAAIQVAVEADAMGQEASIVNLASWFAWPEPFYALGHEGVVFLPDYIAPRSIIDVSTDITTPPDFVRYDDALSNIPLVFGAIGGERRWINSDQPHDVYLMRYGLEPRRAYAEKVGTVGLVARPSSDGTRFVGDGVVWLDSAEITPTGEGLSVRLVWRLEAAPDAPTSVFVHGLGADGNLLDQADGRPMADMYPFEIWQDGSTVADYRYLRGDINEVWVGVYQAVSGERWEATGNGGGILENALELGMPEK